MPQVVELDASAWPVGRYLVEARLGEDRYPAYLVHKITAERRRSPKREVVTIALLLLLLLAAAIWFNLRALP